MDDGFNSDDPKLVGAIMAAFLRAEGGEMAGVMAAEWEAWGSTPGGPPTRDTSRTLRGQIGAGPTWEWVPPRHPYEYGALADVVHVLLGGATLEGLLRHLPDADRQWLGHYYPWVGFPFGREPEPDGHWKGGPRWGLPHTPRATYVEAIRGLVTIA